MDETNEYSLGAGVGVGDDVSGKLIKSKPFSKWLKIVSFLLHEWISHHLWISNQQKHLKFSFPPNDF